MLFLPFSITFPTSYPNRLILRFFVRTSIWIFMRTYLLRLALQTHASTPHLTVLNELHCSHSCDGVRVLRLPTAQDSAPRMWACGLRSAENRSVYGQSFASHDACFWLRRSLLGERSSIRAGKPISRVHLAYLSFFRGFRVSLASPNCNLLGPFAKIEPSGAWGLTSECTFSPDKDSPYRNIAVV